MAADTKEYQRQLERLQPFAERVHIDFMDGEFAPTHSLRPSQVWWQPPLMVDFHIMYKRPLKVLEEAISMQPHLIIIHAESEEIETFIQEAKGMGIKLGVALLKDTSVDQIIPLLPYVDHVLVFSGDLGHFGGEADLQLLEKVTALKSQKPSLEIGWDGGVNDKNARTLSEGGVDVLNTGGFIHDAASPEDAYDTLVAALAK